MRPKQFFDILEENLKGVVNHGKVHHTGRALARLKITSGWDDITPEAAAWALFTLAACPHTQHLDIMMWLKGKQADGIFNNKTDTPAWALGVLLILPEITKTVDSIAFLGSGVMVVLHNDEKKLRVFPKIISTKDGEIEAHTLLKEAHNLTVVPGHILRKISSQLGIVVPGAMKKELKKVFA